MKKLVVLLALVVAVISAKAAILDWAVTATSANVGSTVYLLVGAPGDYADTSALAAAAVSSSTVKMTAPGRYGTPKVTVADDSVTASADFYLAIVSADAKSFNYVQATGMGGKVYDPQNQEASPGTFNTINVATIVAGTSKAFGSGSVTPSEPIPEPTSGLLLVVGGALLALRRRQK